MGCCYCWSVFKNKDNSRGPRSCGSRSSKAKNDGKGQQHKKKGRGEGHDWGKAEIPLIPRWCFPDSSSDRALGREWGKRWTTKGEERSGSRGRESEATFLGGWVTGERCSFCCQSQLDLGQPLFDPVSPLPITSRTWKPTWDQCFKPSWVVCTTHRGCTLL